MMDIINVIFRFFDCFIVIGLAFFVIKYYLIPIVEKIMREYGVFIYNLESDCKNLQLQTQSICENIQDQEQHFQDMQRKFVIWQKKCEERTILQKSAQEKIDSCMQGSYETRSSYIKNDRALEEQLPAIIDNVTKKLQIQFSNIDFQKQYIDELIQVMKEKS